MDGDKDDLSNTGLYNLAKAKPVRPINSAWLIVFGAVAIGLAVTATYAAFIANYAAAVCALASALLVLWAGVAFLWHSVRQLNSKVVALTSLLENDDKKITRMSDTINRIAAFKADQK